MTTSAKLALVFITYALVALACVPQQRVIHTAVKAPTTIKTETLPLILPANAIITDIDTTNQEDSDLVVYSISVPGIQGTIKAATVCTFSYQTLMHYTTMVKFQDKILDLIIPKNIAIHVCGQKDS
jgi:hypothetical protein